MRINKIDKLSPPSKLPVKIKLFDEFLNYMQTILSPDTSGSKQLEGRVVVDGSSYAYQYFLKDHLGNTRITFNESGTIIQEDSYYPYGMNMSGLSHSSGEDLPNKYLYNGKELQDEFGLGWYDYGARFYDPTGVHWTTPDLMAESYYAWSPYNYVRGNPITRFDPNGMWDDEFNDRSRDWVEAANGNIYWDENATSQESTKSGEKYLGKNVLVGTHNRDREGNEDINSARFDLYLETDKTGYSATIYGNTVPSDITKYGTLAEGLYSARFQGRSSYLAKGKEDMALIINEGKAAPTINGNPNKANSDMLTGVFFHSGNPYQGSLSDSRNRPVWSHGCQTSGCGSGSKELHNSFMLNVGANFNGAYYLRTMPSSAQSKFNFEIPIFVMPVDNTYVAPKLIFNR